MQSGKLELQIQVNKKNPWIHLTIRPSFRDVRWHIRAPWIVFWGREAFQAY